MDVMELIVIILTSGVAGGVGVEIIRAIANRRSNQADVRLKRATATGELADAASTVVGISERQAIRLEEDNIALVQKVNVLSTRVDDLKNLVKDAEAFKVALESQQIHSNEMRQELEKVATEQAHEIFQLKETAHRLSERVVNLEDEKEKLKDRVSVLQQQMSNGDS